MQKSPRSFSVNACFATCTQTWKRISEPSETLDFPLQTDACSAEVQSDEPGEQENLHDQAA